MIFRSPAVPSTVCSRRSININLIKQSKVLYSVLLTGSHFFCHCVVDFFLFTCFQFCYSWGELKPNELFPQNAFLQPYTQLGSHNCCIWEKKRVGGHNRMAFQYLWGQWHPTAFQTVWIWISQKEWKPNIFAFHRWKHYLWKTTRGRQLNLFRKARMRNKNRKL